MDWSKHYAERLSSMDHSEVAQILELTSRPEVISLAGGLPSPDSFLIEETQEEAISVFRDLGSASLGYGPTEGLPPLREALAERMTLKGRSSGKGEILLTTGGIAALDLICKALLESGDFVIIEEPSYLAAIQVFRSYGAQFLGIPTDQEGVCLDALQVRLDELIASGRRPKFFYIIPSFQNPSGNCLATERREKLVGICNDRGIPIVEDGAYEDLRFEGEFQSNLASIDSEVVHVNTFSKIMHPGLRLGWINGPEALIETLALCKQGQDQCSSTSGQYLAERFLRKGLVEQQLRKSRAIYREHRNLTIEAFEETFPKESSASRPQGGFYCWINLPEEINAVRLLPEVVENENVAYVGGSAFYHNREMGTNQIRLAYSFVSGDKLKDAVARLGRFFQSKLTA